MFLAYWLAATCSNVSIGETYDDALAEKQIMAQASLRRTQNIFQLMAAIVMYE